MIDTYFDRADAALGYKRRESAPVWEDPRYYCGQLYNTVLDRNVAEAKDTVAEAIEWAARRHSDAIVRGVRTAAWNAGVWDEFLSARYGKAAPKP